MQQDAEKIIEIDVPGVVVLNKYNAVSGLWWKTNFASLSGFALRGFLDAILLGFRYRQGFQCCYPRQKEWSNFPGAVGVQIIFKCTSKFLRTFNELNAI